MDNARTALPLAETYDVIVRLPANPNKDERSGTKCQSNFHKPINTIRLRCQLARQHGTLTLPFFPVKWLSVGAAG